MSYTTGTAADIGEVRTALTGACVADGWTWDAVEEVLHKSPGGWSNGIFVRLTAWTTGDLDYLQMLGRNSLDADSADDVVQIRGFDGCLITWPATYHIFVFDYEVYLILNYSDKYQWLAFGQSQQAGLNGTGNWVAGTIGGGTGSGSFYGSRTPCNDGTAMQSTGAMSSARGPAPGMFWGVYSTSYPGQRNYYLHNGLYSETNKWLVAGSNESVGIRYLTDLINTQPNNFNAETVLLPIRGYAIRPDSKVSQVLEVQNARHVRVDNYGDGEVITIGTDEWKIFPYYRRNNSARDGGVGIDHTGTFGWAIKYETT